MLTSPCSVSIFKNSSSPKCMRPVLELTDRSVVKTTNKPKNTGSDCCTVCIVSPRTPKGNPELLPAGVGGLIVISIISMPTLILVSDRYSRGGMVFSFSSSSTFSHGQLAPATSKRWHGANTAPSTPCLAHFAPPPLLLCCCAIMRLSGAKSSIQ